MSIYLISSVIEHLIPFLALPIITLYILPKEYSNIAMFALLVSFFSAFVGMNAHGAISRKFADKDNIDFPSYIGNAIILFILSIIIVLILAWLFIFKLEEYTLLDTFWILMSILAASLQFIIVIFITLLKMESRSLYYGIFNILKSFLNTGLILILIMYYKYNWEGYLYANLIILFIFSVISSFLMIKMGYIRVKLNFQYINHILKFGLPLILHVLGAIAISMTDRILLINLEGSEAVGIYFLAWQLSLSFSLISEAFKNSYIPWIFSNLKNKNNTKIVKVTYITFTGMCLLGIISIFIINLMIINIFNEKYINTIPLIPYLVTGLVFSGLYHSVVLIIFYAEKTHLLSFLTLLSGILNLIFSYYLIKLNGIVGAAQGTMLAYIIMFLLTWVLASKTYPLPWFSFWRNHEL